MISRLISQPADGCSIRCIDGLRMHWLPILPRRIRRKSNGESGHVGCSTTSPDLWIESARSGFYTLSQQRTSEGPTTSGVQKSEKGAVHPGGTSSAPIVNLIANPILFVPAVISSAGVCLGCCPKKMLEKPSRSGRTNQTLYRSATATCVSRRDFPENLAASEGTSVC